MEVQNAFESGKESNLELVALPCVIRSIVADLYIPKKFTGQIIPMIAESDAKKAHLSNEVLD